MFESLDLKPADAILKLIAELKSDTRENTVDLGVGVYRNAAGDTPVLRAVKKAEQYLVDHQTSKAYLGSRGNVEFCDAIESQVFATDATTDQRLFTLQTPGGSGALRVAAGLILRANPDARMWVSDPTWNNHVPLLGGAGVQLKPYPYYDSDANSLHFEAMLEAFSNIPTGDIVLLHGCCHNPTGMDLSQEQWAQLADIIDERSLVPFVDIAYQGFAEGLEEDAQAVRMLHNRVPEMIVASSCSKNFGLYRERVGTLSLLSKNAEANAIVASQALNVVRTMYSVPPDHGGAIVAKILHDSTLRDEWLGELTEMRERLQAMRKVLTAELEDKAPNHDFSHIVRANGMFCYLGVSPQQVHRLKQEFGVYLVESGRINVCGITEQNAAYIAESVAKVL